MAEKDDTREDIYLIPEHMVISNIQKLAERSLGEPIFGIEYLGRLKLTYKKHVQGPESDNGREH